MLPLPASQYATDANLRARQRLWDHQQPEFDIVEWVLESAALQGPELVLDVGCGNGLYLAGLRARGIDAIGCDLSRGMLAAVSAHADLVNADVAALPFGSSVFDVVLAPHMLYHVADRTTATAEMRRVLRDGGRCVVVTNGTDHVRTLRVLIESAVQRATPGWEMRNPSTHEFSLENGAAQLRPAFAHVTVIRPDDVAPAVISDASVVADYVASVADHYQPQTSRPWPEVVDEVRASVQREIDSTGVFTVAGDTGAFVCR